MAARSSGSSISVLTVSESLHGVQRASGAIQAQQRAFVEELLASADAVPITIPVAWVHAELWGALAAEGPSSASTTLIELIDRSGR